MTRTPTPWVVTPGLNRGSVTIRAEAEKDGDIRKPVAEIWHNGDDPEETAAFVVKAVNSYDALVEALTFHVRNCPLCRGTRKAVSAWDLLTKDNPEPTECERCAPGWAALETPANPIEEVVDATRQD